LTWKNKTKHILAFLLVFTALLDLYSTFKYKNFIALEMNPIYMFTGSAFLLFIAKILIIGGAVWWLYFCHNFKRIYQYGAIYVIIWCILGQGAAGYLNIQNHKDTADALGFENPGDIPLETIEKYKPSNESMLKNYSLIVLLLGYIPAFIALLSFKMWEIIYT
jgi:hypothetical protein